MSACTVVAAANGVIMTYDKTKLREFSGHIHLTRHWAHALLKWMDFVKRAAKSKHTADNSKSFLDNVVSTVSMED